MESANDMRVRCEWVPLNDEIYKAYHDLEWGVPVYDDRKLFEMLLLEGAQAGLSWATILKKSENYRRAFDGFDPAAIAAYTPEKIDELLQDSGIVRNRRKVEAAVTNAQAYLDLVSAGRSLADSLWQFVGGSPRINCYQSIREIPAKTAESDEMSKYLLSRGFKFVGSTICYAFMQSVGMVNDHTVDCFRYSELANIK